MGKLCKGVNDLETQYPNIAKQWHTTLNGSTLPDSVSTHSNKKYFWLCDKGHAYDATPDKRVNGEGCPYCSNHRLLVGFNDLATTNPNIAAEWDYSKNEGTPKDYTCRSTYKAHWKCSTCNWEWDAKIKDRVDSKYQMCPKCTGIQRGKERHKQALSNRGGITDPFLLSEWDFERNARGPEEYTPMSNESVYWICSKCGYRFKASINNRTLRKSCACCAGKVVVAGINDLATTHPQLAAEWHPTKNGDLCPTNVSYGMATRIWWLCPRGHEYSATLLHRSSGTNCPICNSGRQTSFAEQAVYYYVKKIYPDAISRYKEIFDNGMELDIYIPDIKLGIEYDGVYWHHKNAASYEREKRKYETCKNNGIRLLRIREKRIGDNEFPPADMSAFLPENETETDALNHTIQMVLAKIDPDSNMWTRSNPKHFWSDVNVDVDKDRFEILAYLAGPVKNSISEVAPELISEWDYDRNGKLTPEMIAAGSSLSVHWICRKCGYQWVTSVYHRALSHTGCPKCAGLVFEKGINDLATKNPELLKEWDYELNAADGLDPSEIQYNSNIKAHWICSICGHKWITNVRNRTIVGNGCIQCGYKAGKALKLKNTLEKQGCITNPLLLKEWDYEKNNALGLNPEMLPPGSSKSAYWICSTCGYRWKAPIARRNNGSGCRKCADKANPELRRKALVKAGHGLTDPLLIKEWDYTKNAKQPTDYSYGSGAKVHWICSTCGYSWQATINSRHKGAGCPACAGNVLQPGKNDLYTMKPDIAAEWDYEKNNGIVPECVSYSANKKYWWICPKGHDSYLAAPSHRVNGTGCPICGNMKISEKQNKAVDQFAIDGSYIKTFPSLKTASIECGVSSPAISHAIKKGTVSAGFRWKYHD